jgi:hypothetical protein
MDSKSNSQGAANDASSRLQVLQGFDIKKVSFFDFVEGRRSA